MRVKHTRTQTWSVSRHSCLKKKKLSELLSFEEWVTKQLLVHIDFDSREKKYYGSHCEPATVWFSTFFKIAFMFSRRSKLRFKTTFECVNEGIKIKHLPI